MEIDGASHSGSGSVVRQAVEAICQLAGGTVQGRRRWRGRSPSTGHAHPGGRHAWDIGSAGSTTTLVLALLPLLVVRARRVQVELGGGLFQDFAPLTFHLQHALLPLLARMGATVRAELGRPGHVPSGSGTLRLEVVANAAVPPRRAAARLRRVTAAAG